MSISFKSFVATNLSTNLLESPVGTQMNEPVPLLINMTRNVLNAVRGDTKTQTKVLKWIWGEGLHQALVGRKLAAEKASQQLTKLAGRPVLVRQEQLFDRAIYPNIAKRLGVPEDQFSQVMDQAVQLYKTQYEPDEIPLDGRKVIKLDKLNQWLSSKGLEPFSFDGFAEKYENDKEGKWAPKLAHRNPYGEDDPVRHGLDLTEPEYGLEPGTEAPLYKYNTWAPPVGSGRNYGDAIEDAQRLAYQHKTQSTDDPDLDKWYGMGDHSEVDAGASKSIGKVLGFNNKSRTEFIPVDPKAYPVVKKWFMDGVKANYPYTEDEFNKIFAQVINDEKHALRGSFKIHGSKYMPIVASIDRGARDAGVDVKKAAADGIIPANTGYMRTFDDSPYAFELGKDAYEQVPMDLEKLQQDGWDVVTDPKSIVDPLQNKNLLLRKGKRGEEIRLTKGEDGEWYTDRRKRGAGTYKPIGGRATAPVLGLSQITRGEDGEVTNKAATANPHAHSRGRYKLMNGLTSKMFKDLVQNPNNFGETPLTPKELSYLPPSAHGYPPSLVRGAVNAIRKAAGYGLTGTTSDHAVRSMFSDDLVNDLYVRMQDYANDRRFKYGDLNAFAPKQIGATIDDQGNEIEGAKSEPSSQDIFAELRRSGVEDPNQAKVYVQKLQQILAAGKDPSTNDFPKPVLDAFLRNGANWRKRRGAYAMVGEIGKQLKNSPGQFKQYTNKEGGTQDADVGDEEATRISDMQGKLRGKTVRQAQAQDGSLVANKMGYNRDAALQAFAKDPTQSKPVSPVMQPPRPSVPQAPAKQQPVQTPQAPAAMTTPTTPATAPTAATRQPGVSQGLRGRISTLRNAPPQPKPAPPLLNGLIKNPQDLETMINRIEADPSGDASELLDVLEREIMGSNYPGYLRLMHQHMPALIQKVRGKAESTLLSYQQWQNQKLLEHSMNG